MSDREIEAIEIASINYLGRDEEKDFNVFECDIGAKQPQVIGFSKRTSAKFIMHLIDSMRTDGKTRPQQRMLSVDEKGVPNAFALQGVNAFRLEERLYSLQIDIGDGLLVPVTASRVELRRLIDQLSRAIDAPLTAN